VYTLAVQDAGESSVANIDKLRHSSGSVSPAVLRLKMQKVMLGSLNLLNYLSNVIIIVWKQSVYWSRWSSGVLCD